MQQGEHFCSTKCKNCSNSCTYDNAKHWGKNGLTTNLLILENDFHCLFIFLDYSVNLTFSEVENRIMVRLFALMKHYMLLDSVFMFVG